MKSIKKSLIIAAAAAALIAPSTGRADVVFDPTNFVEAVEQVNQDIQLVAQLRQQVQNQLAMLKGWDFTQLAGILQSMEVWREALGQGGDTYGSTDPGPALDQQYPVDPGAYADVSDASIQSTRSRWDQEERQVLVENRTVQDQTYLNLAPTAQRIAADLEHSDAAPGVTAAMQAGNEELATLIAQLQTLQSQELTDARGEVERDAREQAEEAYAQQQDEAVRAGWDNPPPPNSGLADAFSLARQ